MHLRTTAESDTYAYATSPLNFGGVEKEDLLFWMIPMAIANNIMDDPFYAFAVGCFCLWLYKRLTANTPPGHMVLRLSIVMGQLESGDLATMYPAVRKVARALNRFLTNLWLEVGLLPSPTYCNRYEP